jgi:hypothetical protein
MYNFKKTAEKMTVLSELMTGREQIKTKDIIKKYADGVTITDFDFAVLDDKAFVVLTFAEDNTKYYNGGLVATKIFQRIVDDFDGDILTARDEYAKADEKLHLVFELAETKQGNTVVRVSVK